MDEFESPYENEYIEYVSRLERELDDLARKYEPKYHAIETDDPNVVFETMVDIEDYSVVHQVTPNKDKNNWKNVMVKR
ncbi:hypothetical protein ACSAZL_01195 [Methanosarcina sp. T3]|uniref:hypothetical protein n=1 Tax=Methanosarcina sp. T3 TaxID=3439062 RepID=UPI003F87BD82